MTIKEFKKWIDNRLIAAKIEIKQAYQMEQLDKVRQFRTLIDELNIIKSKLDKIEES